MATSIAPISSFAEAHSILSDPPELSRGSTASNEAPKAASVALGSNVASIRVGQEDGRGVGVEQIYAVKNANYAIYRAHDRVMVQFADDVFLADEQRKRLDGLAATRAKLAMLTDGLDKERTYYDGRIAHALQLALEGEVGKSCEIMALTVSRAEAERTGRGRIQYLISGFATAALFLALLGIGYAAVSFAKPANELWLAAIGGAIGAAFSMSIAVRSRTVAFDLDRNANIAEAALRILVGVISAGVLILLMATKLVPELRVGSNALIGDAATWETILLIGFIAGFLERLLPNVSVTDSHT